MGAAISIITAVAVAVVSLFRSLSPPKTPTPATQSFTEKMLKELREEAKQKLSMDMNLFNFAVAGQSRTGKSSLVNAMRLIPDNHPAAAIVGETETTKKPQAFPHPELKHVVIWDMPGSGTASHPIDTYFKDKCLIGFDALIVNCTGVVTEGELYIAKEADRAGIPVIIVRNKANNDLESRRRRCPEKTKETHKAELIAEFRSNIKKDLATKTLSHLPIFVVNAWSFLDPESPSFEEKEFMEMLHKIASKRN